MRKILVIEDDPIVRQTIARILERKDYKVVVAVNGLLGLRLFQSEQPDLVITDIVVPDKEGIETIADIRRDRATTPIIAISGGGRRGNVDFLAIAKKFGANEILAKPFAADDLLGSVARCLASA